MFNTLEEYHNEYGGYHEYTEGCSVHQDVHSNPMVFSVTFPTLTMVPPGILRRSTGELNIPQCTAHTPMYCRVMVETVELVEIW